MKRVASTIVALLMAAVLILPVQAIGGILDGIPDRTEDGVVFVPLRQVAYAHDFAVEWDGVNRAAHLAHVHGAQIIVSIAAVGGFIEAGTSWIPLEYALELFSPFAQDTVTAADAVVNFMNMLVAGDIFGATMAMSPEMWQVFDLDFGLLLPRGSVVDFAILDASYMYGFYVADLTITHTTGTSVSRISVNEHNEIAGLFTLAFAFEPMEPAHDAAYTAQSVVVGADTAWPLDGVLTMPHGASAESPVPAVILVHGSGPQNMDSSVFDNRPFFDIADYLSGNGIAVLRYNKRTFEHGAEFAAIFGEDVVVWDETIEDALLAAEFLRADPRVGDVFVLGLSLGGSLAPRIAYEGDLAGAILLAATPRPLYELQFDQNVLSLHDAWASGFLPPEQVDFILAMLEMWLQEAMEIPNLSPEEMQGMLAFGIPALYHMSIVESAPLPIIARSEIPMLILQGGMDFQVFAEIDFQMFVDYTQDMAHVTAILYDELNHLFMVSGLPPGILYIDMMDYAIPGRVDAQVLRDIVQWIADIASAQ